MITYIKKGAPQYKANLHCHSVYSDGKLTPEQQRSGGLGGRGRSPGLPLPLLISPRQSKAGRVGAMASPPFGPGCEDGRDLGVLRTPKESLINEYKNDYEILKKAFQISGDDILWHSQSVSVIPNDIFTFFDDFLNTVLFDLHRKILEAFVSPISDEPLEEGSVKNITSTRYERNRKARELCLSYHGKACKRCGLDFAKKYGEEYANLIEVHHIVPISEIGEGYIVDPIKDLIPLCPNCHAMTHYDIKCH